MRYNTPEQKKKGASPILKKLAALLLSLLLCLSLLPGQALAADEPAPVEPPAVEEPLDPKDPDEPGEPPVEPLSEVPEGNDSGQKGDD